MKLSYFINFIFLLAYTVPMLGKFHLEDRNQSHLKNHTSYFLQTKAYNTILLLKRTFINGKILSSFSTDGDTRLQ